MHACQSSFEHDLIHDTSYDHPQLQQDVIGGGVIVDEGHESQIVVDAVQSGRDEVQEKESGTRYDLVDEAADTVRGQIDAGGDHKFRTFGQEDHSDRVITILLVTLSRSHQNT